MEFKVDSKYKFSKRIFFFKETEFIVCVLTGDVCLKLTLEIVIGIIKGYLQGLKENKQL